MCAEVCSAGLALSPVSPELPPPSSSAYTPLNVQAAFCCEEQEPHAGSYRQEASFCLNGQLDLDERVRSRVRVSSGGFF